MSADDKVERAKNWILKCIESNQLAHAYLLAGHPSITRPFANFILTELMTEKIDDPVKVAKVQSRIERHEYPDIVWIEPESKSRVIRIGQIRDDLNEKIGQTSYLGGWKSAVLLDADRMNPNASNAFLKTLEEPPARTILLLLSEHPDELLPTIRSRCQYIALFQGTRPHSPPWGEELLAILRQGHPAEPLYAIKLSSELQALLARERERAEKLSDRPDEDSKAAVKEIYDARISAQVLTMRHEVLQWFIMWQRDVMMCVLDADPKTLHFPAEIEHLRGQAAGLDSQAAERVVEEADSLARRLQLNVPDGLILNDSLLTQAAIAYRSRAGK